MVEKEKTFTATNPLGRNVRSEEAVEIRAILDGLETHTGFKFLKQHFLKRATELRKVGEISDNDFSTVNAHNRRFHEADAIERLFLWVGKTVAFCDRTIEGGKKR